MRSGVLTASVALIIPAAAAAEGHAGCLPRLVAELPVKLLGLHPVLLARLNGSEIPVVMDTGSSVDLITYGTAGKLHLQWQLISRHATLSGVGGDSGSLPALTHADLQFGDLHLGTVDLFVSGADIGSAAGIVGREILGRYDIDYELRAGKVRLINPAGCEGVLPSDWARLHAYSMVATTHSGNAPIVTGYVNDVEMRILFDTGAGTTILDARAASRASLSKDSPGAMADAATSGVGQHWLKTWLVAVAALRIGDEEIRNTRVRIGHLGLGDADMVLGTDFFLSHRVFFANSQHKIFISYSGGPVFDSSPLRQAAP
jgi:predicted aspartyl protease